MNLNLGDKLAVPGPAGVTHVGIYAGGGFVVHNSKRHGRVVEEPVQRFADGQPVTVLERAAAGWGPEVVRRARAHLGQAYDLLSFNCEHLTSLALEGEARSPQVKGGLLVALLTLFASVLAWDQRGWDADVGRHRDSAGRFRKTWI